MEHSYQILDEQQAYRGFFKINRYQLQHSSYEGGDCPPIVRERLEGLGVTSVLLFDPVLDEVVLVEQFRIGLAGLVSPPWCLETVSGYCDKEHESPADVAKREAIEESGCEIKAMKLIGEFYVSPGISVEKLSLYVACVDASKAMGIHGLEEEGEEIKVIRMPWEQAEQEMFKTLNSTSIVVAMQWMQMNREKLIDEWRPLILD